MIKISICFIVKEVRQAGTISHSAKETETKRQTAKEREARERAIKRGARERAISREKKTAIKNMNRQGNSN